MRPSRTMALTRPTRPPDSNADASGLLSRAPVWWSTALVVRMSARLSSAIAATATAADARRCAVAVSPSSVRSTCRLKAPMGRSLAARRQQRKATKAYCPGVGAGHPAAGQRRPRRSAPGEAGLSRALFEERAHAGAGVVGLEHLRERLLLELEPRGEGGLEALVDEPLGEPVGDERP